MFIETLLGLMLNRIIEGTVHLTKYRPSPIPAGGLEIPLMLTFKSTRFVTHQKMKDFMTSLYSYEYEPQEINSKDEANDDINFIIEQDEDEEDSEVVLKPKKRKKPPIISETSSESSENEICSEHSEVVKAKKKKSRIISYSSAESSEDEGIWKLANLDFLVRFYYATQNVNYLSFI